MTPIAATFGAPVTEPHGNSAANTSSRPTSARGRAVMSEVSCQTVSYRSGRKRVGTRTDPTSAMRARSLRSRSTIITFSARCLALAVSAARMRPSSSLVVPRRAVPFMGRVVMPSSSQRKKSSGLALAMTCRPGL